MSLFGDLDVAGAIDPFEIPDGTYKAVTGEVKRETSKDGSKVGLTLKYTIDDEDSPYNGRKASEWKTIPKGQESEDDRKALGYLKQRLNSLGVPEDKMNSVEPEELNDIPVVITIKNNNGYVNVNRVALREEDASFADGANPFAS